MREKEFDQFFRDRLAGHSSPVPEDMWQRIQGKKDDRKAFVLWWVLGGGLVLASLLAGRFWKAGVPVEKVAKTTENVGSKRVGGKTGADRTAGVEGKSGVEGKAGANGKSGADGKSGVGGKTGAGSDVARSEDRGNAARLEDRRDAARSEQRGDAARSEHRGHASRSGHWGDTSRFGHWDDEKSGVDGVRPKGVAWREDSTRVMERVHKNRTLPGRADMKKRLPVRAGELKVRKDITIQKKKRPITLDLYVSPSNASNAGVRVAVPVWKDFSLITGLQYTRVGFPRDRDSVIHISSGHFNNIDLPLLVGYSRELGWGKIGVNTGVIFNLHSWVGGDSATLYRYLPKTAGTSWYLGVDLEKYLGRKWSLFAEPYYRYQASGVSLGFRYIFKK